MFIICVVRIDYLCLLHEVCLDNMNCLAFMYLPPIQLLVLTGAVNELRDMKVYLAIKLLIL